MELHELHRLIEDAVSQVYHYKQGYRYEKLVRTGYLEFHDYGAGIVEFKIGYNFYVGSNRAEYNHCVQLTVSNIDDGLLVCRLYFPTKEECIRLIDEFANSEFYRNLTTFSRLSDLQEEVSKFGFYLEPE
jgi:hypothetical protein